METAPLLVGCGTGFALNFCRCSDTLTETTDCNEVLILFRIMRAAADSVRVWTANGDQQTARVPSQSMYA